MLCGKHHRSRQTVPDSGSSPHGRAHDTSGQMIYCIGCKSMVSEGLCCRDVQTGANPKASGCLLEKQK